MVNLDKLTYAGNLDNLRDLESDPRYRFVQGDICDAQLVEQLFAEEGIDAVAHFAAESHVDRTIVGPGEFIHTNIIGTFTLLEAARIWGFPNPQSPVPPPLPPRLHRRSLRLSRRDRPVHRNHPLRPALPLLGEQSLLRPPRPRLFHTYGLPVVITNCSNNYGPYQFPEKLIPLVINNALAGKELPVYGDGKNVRDWLYVHDHCRALLTVLEQGQPGETYNIGGNSEKQNIEVVRTICDILDELAPPLPVAPASR